MFQLREMLYFITKELFCAQVQKVSVGLVCEQPRSAVLSLC